MKEVEVEIYDYDEVLAELNDLEDEFFEKSKPNQDILEISLFCFGVISFAVCFYNFLWFLYIIPCVLVFRQFLKSSLHNKNLDFLAERIDSISSSLNFLKDIDGTLYTDGKDLYVDSNKVENIAFQVIKSDETKLVGKRNTLKGYELLLFVES